MKKHKISIIGSGQIGGNIANLLSLNNIGEVFLYDIKSGMSKGKSLDIGQSSAIIPAQRNTFFCDDISNIQGSDVVVITAGLPRQKGMSRDDLLIKNSNIISDIAKNIEKFSPDSFVIVLTNPLDTMVWLFSYLTNLPKNKIVGMAGILDSARFAYFLSKELNLCIEDIQTIVLGGHGDLMVPLERYTSIAGIPLVELLETGVITQDKLNEIINRTQSGGAEIVSLLGQGSAFYAPAASAFEMICSYLRNEKKILPCSVYLTGEYDVNDLFIGVPVVIGSNGIEKIIELKLNTKEKNMFNKSVNSVYNLVNNLKNTINKKEI